MSRKPPRRYDGSRESEPAAAPGMATLADALGGAFAGRKAPKAKPRPAVVVTQDPAAPAAPAAPARPAGPRVLTPEQVMDEAMADIDRTKVYDGKYRGLGFQTPGIVIHDPTAEAESQSVLIPFEELGPQLNAEELLFREAMGNTVQKLEFDRRLKSLREHDWVGAQWHDVAELDRLSNDALYEPALTGDQRVLLKRALRGRVREMSIRMLTLREALQSIEFFARTCIRDGDLFARIITGKGRNSSEGPVLKPAVVRWCESDGKPWVKGWAPETDRSGTFGSIVVELRRP